MSRDIHVLTILTVCAAIRQDREHVDTPTHYPLDLSIYINKRHKDTA